MIDRSLSALATMALMLLPTLSVAQSDAQKVDWLRANGHPVRSIQSSKDDDYSDLYALGQALKNVRVVGIGESAHGDGTTFTMKVRLVRYLHEQLGFDVIAWESNVFGVWQTDTALRDPASSALAAARPGIFGVWSRTEQLLPLWDYLKESKNSARPIELAGFDMRFSTEAARYLRGFFAKAGQIRGEEARWDRFEQAVGAQRESGERGYRYSNPLYEERFVADLLRRLESERGRFRQVWSDSDIDFAHRLLTNADYFERYLREEMGGKSTPAFTRDMGMGLNLLWLVEKRYPDRKIIVWAATGHLMNDFQPSADDANFRVAGLRGSSFAPVKHALGPQAYSLVFLSSEGSSGYSPPLTPPFTIPEPPAGSLGALCRDTDRPLFFLDFMSLPAQHWLRRPVTAGFRWHGGRFSTPQSMTLDWTTRHDGMIYIRRMEPCVTLQEAGS